MSPDTNGLGSPVSLGGGGGGNTATLVTLTTNNSHLELLTKAVTDAHIHTCVLTTDQIVNVMRKQCDLNRIVYFKNLSHENQWLECAQKLTDMIKQIIEFAKMVPGFMKFSQDDQIVLLKAGSFELCCLRMSRYYDMTTKHVVFGDNLMPMDAFLSQADITESKLVTQAFGFAEHIADLKLTEAELALFSAFVLISPDRPGLKGIIDIQRLNQALLKALRFELSKTHKVYIKGDVTVLDILLSKTPGLREMSMLHMEALCKFRRSAPHLDFPDLYKELFSVDI